MGCLQIRCACGSVRQKIALTGGDCNECRFWEAHLDARHRHKNNHRRRPQQLYDPEPGDENDPSYNEELFEIYRAMKVKPDELPDMEYRTKYAAWLKAH